MKQLLEQAIIREKDDHIIHVRHLHKEMEEERKLFGAESEKFITSSYKRQLELNKIHEEERKKQEENEKAHTAEKAGMNSFYLNMLDNKNVAYGGSTDDLKELVNKVGQKRAREQELMQEGKEEEELRERDRKRRLRERAARDNEEAEKIRKQRDVEKERKVKELQEEYAKHTVTDEEKERAKERALQRMQLRKEAKESQ